MQSLRDPVLVQVRKAKKFKALATHPDKLGDKAVGSALAFQRITEAAEALADEASRQKYARMLSRSNGSTTGKGPAAATQQPGGSSSPGNQGSGTYIPCSTCGNMHKIIPTETPLSSARWCSSCNTHHPAKNGEGWRERSGGVFPATRVYVASEGVVYDITEWAECGDMVTDASGNRLPCNTHHAPLHFSTFSSSSSSSQKGDSPSRPGKKPKKAGKKGGRRRV